MTQNWEKENELKKEEFLKLSFHEEKTSGLYYKNILMIVSDDRLYYSTGVIYNRHLMCFTLAL